MQLSNNKIKELSLLKQKKYRDLNHVFSVEGEKIVSELLQSSFKIKLLVAVSEWINANKKIINNIPEVYEASEEQLKRISNLITPNKVYALCEMPDNLINIAEIKGKLSLFLDGIQDPGNMGTILRLADWFGIEHVICSNETVDVFNPKVIQSTMGAFLRVKTFYTQAEDWLQQAQKEGIAIACTLLDGKNMYSQKLPNEAIIVLGNESKGISEKVEKYASHRLNIPSFPENRQGSESLNVAIAAAICCAEFRRQQVGKQ
jgi:TrmH family RNA methyltransferase